VLGGDPALLTDPDALMHTLKHRLMWIFVAAAVLLAAYIAIDLVGRRWRRSA
jgi:hypothetical protein